MMSRADELMVRGLSDIAHELKNLNKTMEKVERHLKDLANTADKSNACFEEFAILVRDEMDIDTPIMNLPEDPEDDDSETESDRCDTETP